MKKPPEQELPIRETAAVEQQVLVYFLNSGPQPHKPLGKNAQAKRRAKERRRLSKKYA